MVKKIIDQIVWNDRKRNAYIDALFSLIWVKYG